MSVRNRSNCFAVLLLRNAAAGVDNLRRALHKRDQIPPLQIVSGPIVAFPIA